MDARSPDFTTALRLALAERPARGGEHPLPETLVAYHHDRLPPAEADALQEHLAACRSCADLVLELAQFTAAEPTETSAGPEHADDWHLLAERLRRESADSSPFPADAPPAVAAIERRRRRPVRFAYALAAALAFATIGLALWVAALRGELATLREPVLNVSIVNLEPAGFTRGGEAAATAAAGERFVAILNPPSFPRDVAHRVEVLDAGGRRLWSADGLSPTEAGNFHLELTRRLLPPGEYRLRLLLGDEPVAEFTLRVTS